MATTKTSKTPKKSTSAKASKSVSKPAKPSATTKAESAEKTSLKDSTKSAKAEKFTDFKLSRTKLNAKPVTVTPEQLLERVDEDGQGFFYLDKENTHKQVLALVQNFEKKGLSVYHRTVKYGLDDDDYMYEVHIL